MGSAILRQFCNTLPVFHSTTTRFASEWPPLRRSIPTHYRDFRQRQRLVCKRLRSLGPYTQRSTGFLLFPPGPDWLPNQQEPTTTFQSSNGCPTFRLTKSTRRFAHPQRACGLSGPCHVVTLTSFVRTLTLAIAPEPFRLVAALGC